MVREHIASSLFLIVHIYAERQKKIFLNSWDVFPVGWPVFDGEYSLLLNTKMGKVNVRAAVVLSILCEFILTIPAPLLLPHPPTSLEAP